MNLSNLHRVALATMPALLTGQVGPARAESLVTQDPIPVLVVTKKLAKKVLYLQPGSLVPIALDSAVIETDAPRRWKIKLTVKPGRDHIQFTVPEHLPDEDIHGRVMIATRRYSVQFVVQPATAENPPTPALSVEHKSWIDFCESQGDRKAKDALQMRDQAHAQEMTALRTTKDTRIAELEQENQGLRSDQDTQVNARILGGALDDFDVVPINQHTPDEPGVHVAGAHWITFQNRRILRYVVVNNRSGDLPVMRVQVLNQRRDRDHAGTVLLGSATPRASKNDPIAVIPAGESMLGAAYVDDIHAIGAHAVLAITGPNEIVASIGKIPMFPPKLTPREQRARQVIVGVHGMYGAFWIADNMGVGQLAVTSFQGLGVRVTKGFIENIAFEVEAGAATTGTARFDDRPFGGVQGDLARSATLGRVRLGGVLRFGDRIIPHARLGLGVQIASVHSEHDPGGGMEPAITSEFDIGGFFGLGGGLDIRLGEHVIAGAQVSYEGGKYHMISAGLHLSYGWTP